ncbi:MAG: hypothetical protein MUP58_02185 [Candidatus Nanohaloarchaeota archaeon QJJ-9]|nr:hypothetical protein [Candidatus Nanohaloarchaeota archaeon QJJ-9]
MEVERDIADAEDWYETTGVTALYEAFVDLLTEELGFDEVHETYYEENADTGQFKTKIYAEKQLGKGGLYDIGSDTTLVLEFTYFLAHGPSEKEDGEFAQARIQTANISIKVDMPGKDRWIDSLFRRIWFNLVYKDQFHRWVEVAEETMNDFLNICRDFLGFEPVVGKARRLDYEPLEHSI